MPKQPSRKSRANQVDMSTVDAVPPSEVNSTLDARFDTLLARMQTPDVRKGMEAAFDLSSAQLGSAAVRASRSAVEISEGAPVKAHKKRFSKFGRVFTALREMLAARHLARQIPELHPVEMDAPVKASRKQRGAKTAQKK